MKRIAVLRENPTPARLAQIDAIRERLRPDLDEQARSFRTPVADLAVHGIHLRACRPLREHVAG
jgi:hypothetical protein